jgi:hypothetical protein
VRLTVVRKAGLNLVGGLRADAAERVELVADIEPAFSAPMPDNRVRLWACTNVRLPYWRSRSSLVISGFSTPMKTFFPTFT